MVNRGILQVLLFVGKKYRPNDSNRVSICGKVTLVSIMDIYRIPFMHGALSISCRTRTGRRPNASILGIFSTFSNDPTG